MQPTNKHWTAPCPINTWRCKQLTIDDTRSRLREHQCPVVKGLVIADQVTPGAEVRRRHICPQRTLRCTSVTDRSQSHYLYRDVNVQAASHPTLHPLKTAPKNLRKCCLAALADGLVTADTHHTCLARAEPAVREHRPASAVVMTLGQKTRKLENTVCHHVMLQSHGIRISACYRLIALQIGAEELLPAEAAASRPLLTTALESYHHFGYHLRPGNGLPATACGWGGTRRSRGTDPSRLHVRRNTSK